MLLSRLLEAIPEAQITGTDTLDIRDIAYDSRQVTAGALFVAVPAVGGDAHSGGIRFVEEAARRGAIAVVAQADVGVDGVTLVRVPSARPALADLAAQFFGHPSRQLYVYGVTGTDGKTTTTYLLEQILSHAGHRTGLIGTVEIKVGDNRSANLDRMTTPESLDVQRLLARMRDTGVSHVAMEASSHALALQRLRGCDFAACALTNITADHVEFHGSWDAYFAAKQSLFTEVAPGCSAVLNRDDEHFEQMAAAVTGPVVTYSLRRDADARATCISPGPRGTRFTLVTGEGSAEVELPLAGLYNVSNALAAAALALLAGVPIESVASGLTHASAPPGRLQAVAAGQPFEVLVDYAHTVNAFRSVLSTVRDQTRGRVIAVFGAAGNRDRSKRPVFARIAGEYANLTIVTNEDPFGEQAEAIIDEVLAGAPAEERGQRFLREPDRSRAIERAMQEARDGDTVLILGKGHEQSIVVNGHKQPWSDVAAARRALEALT